MFPCGTSVLPELSSPQQASSSRFTDGARVAFTHTHRPIPVFRNVVTALPQADDVPGLPQWRRHAAGLKPLRGRDQSSSSGSAPVSDLAIRAGRNQPPSRRSRPSPRTAQALLSAALTDLYVPERSCLLQNPKPTPPQQTTAPDARTAQPWAPPALTDWYLPGGGCAPPAQPQQTRSPDSPRAQV